MYTHTGSFSAVIGANLSKPPQSKPMSGRYIYMYIHVYVRFGPRVALHWEQTYLIPLSGVHIGFIKAREGQSIKTLQLR